MLDRELLGLAALLTGCGPGLLGDRGGLLRELAGAGDLAAVRAESGAVAWSDSLASSRGRNSLVDLSAISGLPVVDQGRVYAVGVGGLLVSLDLRSGRPVPAAELVGALLDHVRLELLETGDLAVVSAYVDRVLRGGGGAARQRAAAAEGGLGAVIAMLVAGTRSGLGPGAAEAAAPPLPPTGRKP